MRKEYKSSLFIIVKNIVYGVAGGFTAALVASWFLGSSAAIVIGFAVCAAIIYFAVIGDNITVVVENGEMIVSRFSRELHRFTLDECAFNAKIVTTSDMTGGDSDCTLRVIDADGEETSIDCTMMGRTRFMRLLEDLGLVNGPAVPLATTRKSE